MEVITVVAVILASVISATLMYIFDKNKDGKITEEEITETMEDLTKKN